MTARLAWDITKGTVSEFMEDNVLRLSAALAYYAMFSIGPLLVIVIAVAGLIFEKKAVGQEVVQQIQAMIGPKAAETVQTMLTEKHSSSVIATILGTVALIFGASGVFGQLQDSLNTIWEVKPKPGQGVWGFIRNRFLSFAMVLGIAFLLLVSMVITAGLELFSGMINHILPMPEIIAKGLHLTISFLVITLLFAMIYKVLPDATVKWRDVWVGAIGTALLFTVGKYLIGMYLGRESTSSAYGAAGSVVVILLWVYYSSLILFFGAEFTQVYAKKTGSRIAPSPHAMPVTEEKRAEEGIPRRDQEPSGAPEEPEPAYAFSHLPPESYGAEPNVAPAFGDGKSLIVAGALGTGFVGGWWAHRKLSDHRKSRGPDR
jgi:membrane protein